MSNQIAYEKQMKYPYGFTDEQVGEAFGMYELKVKTEVVMQLQNEFPLIEDTLEEDDSLLEIILRTIELATSKGAQMMEGHSVLHYYQEWLQNEGKPSYSVSDYEFEDGKGISGVLMPSGTFIKCGNAEHYMVVENIDFETQKKCVYFSSLLNSKDGILSLSSFGDQTMTNEQIHWIEINLPYLDDAQKHMFEILKM